MKTRDIARAIDGNSDALRERSDALRERSMAETSKDYRRSNAASIRALRSPARRLLLPATGVIGATKLVLAGDIGRMRHSELKLPVQNLP